MQLGGQPPCQATLWARGLCAPGQSGPPGQHLPHPLILSCWPGSQPWPPLVESLGMPMQGHDVPRQGHPAPAHSHPPTNMMASEGQERPIWGTSESLSVWTPRQGSREIEPEPRFRSDCTRLHTPQAREACPLAHRPPPTCTERHAPPHTSTMTCRPWGVMFR